LRAETQALRTKTRDQAALIDRLQRRLGHGYIVPAAAGMLPGGTGLLPAAGEGDTERARQNLSEAEAALNAARNPPARADAPRASPDSEIRALRARAEDQAGEIARLKAALAAFEQTDQGSGLKNSKIALKARAGSAEAQAERQAATISRLRGELAAVHDRLARQAAHFMDEMRRIGSGTQPASGQQRRDSERRKLVERVAQVPQVRPTVPSDKARQLAAPGGDKQNGAEKGTGNGHDDKTENAASVDKAAPAGPAAAEPAAGNGRDGKPESAPAQAAAAKPAVFPSAAEMPKTATIPGRRKLRLLDRITGLAKN
jgi:hypothetical protein